MTSPSTDSKTEQRIACFENGCEVRMVESILPIVSPIACDRKYGKPRRELRRGNKCIEMVS